MLAKGVLGSDWLLLFSDAAIGHWYNKAFEFEACITPPPPIPIRKKKCLYPDREPETPVSTPTHSHAHMHALLHASCPTFLDHLTIIMHLSISLLSLLHLLLVDKHNIYHGYCRMDPSFSKVEDG